MELLRFATAGSVDDGKSTLIGRLLYDSKPIFEDQLEAVERTSGQRGDEYTEPRPAHRRPAGRTRAGHHHRRRLPLLRHARSASSSSPTRPGTSSTPATWSPAARRPTSSCSWSTPARASSSRPGATPSSPRCSGSPTWCCASTRWTWSATRQERFEEIRDEFIGVRRAARGLRPDVHPDLGADGRQRRGALARDALV